MVKFSENDATCSIVLGKLESLLQPKELRGNPLALPSVTPVEKPQSKAKRPKLVGIEGKSLEHDRTRALTLYFLHLVLTDMCRSSRVARAA